MVLNSAFAFMWSPGDCSVAERYPSSTNTYRDKIIADRVPSAVRPFFRVRTITLSNLSRERRMGQEGPIYDCVWRLNPNAAAMHATVFYEQGEEGSMLLCVQIMFSKDDSTSMLSWRDSCDWVSATEATPVREARSYWTTFRGRVGYLIASRRQRGPREEADKAVSSCSVMNKAIVLCGEDIKTCLGPFLFGVLYLAETMLEAEVVHDFSA